MSGETHERAMASALRSRSAKKAAAAAAASASAEGGAQPDKPRSTGFIVWLTVALLLAAGLVGWFGVMACRDSIERQTAETEAFRREVANMRTVIAGRDVMLKEVEATRRAHAALSGALLKPLLGSYAMQAKTLLEAEADAAGLSGVQFTDVVPCLRMPAVTPVSKTPYVQRSVRVTAVGSYQRLATFVCRVERRYPMVLLDSLSITSDAGREIVQQRGEFVFSWLSVPDGGGAQ